MIASQTMVEPPPPPVIGARWVPLTLGKWALVDDDDFEAVCNLTWYCKPSGRTFYARRSRRFTAGEFLYLHQFLWARMGGHDTPQIDHIDGDGLNNRRANLRAATVSENQANAARRTDNSSGFKGVDHRGGPLPWRAFIRVNGKRIYLGRFLTPQETASAYDDAALIHFGKFALLNISRQGGLL